MASVLLSADVAGHTIWSGLTYNFSKPPNSDPTLPESQDAITPGVVLTRGQSAGLYNIAVEQFYDQTMYTSPAGTEWASEINNPGAEIAATNWAALSFVHWADAYGGANSLRNNIVGARSVLHLIDEDIYLDIECTGWSAGFGSGGSFSYMRAEPPQIVTTGDYNGNGVVDAADYTTWRDALGQMVATAGDGADGTGPGGIPDGVVDQLDYEYWKSHFGDLVTNMGSGAATGPARHGGSSSGAAFSQVAVPEPAADVLLFVGLAIMRFHRR